MEMITYYPACDWITLTGSGVDQYQVMKSIRVMTLAEYGGTNKQSSRNVVLAGYKGVLTNTDIGTLYLGGRWESKVSNQKRSRGYMLRVSSALADTCVSVIAKMVTDDEYSIGLSKLRCTRFDVQLTLPSVCNGSDLLYESVYRLHETNASAIKSGSGRPPKARLIKDTNNNPTLYIGARTSDIFVRVYEKKDLEGYEYTRFEIELKGQSSASLFSSVLNGFSADYGAVFAGCIRAQIFKMPLSMLYRSHRDYVSAWDALEKRRFVKVSDELAWVFDVALPASINRLMEEGVVLDDSRVNYVNHVIMCCEVVLKRHKQYIENIVGDYTQLEFDIWN